MSMVSSSVGSAVITITMQGSPHSGTAANLFNEAIDKQDVDMAWTVLSDTAEQLLMVEPGETVEVFSGYRRIRHRKDMKTSQFA